jgi:hypothetical protein
VHLSPDGVQARPVEDHLEHAGAGSFEAQGGEGRREVGHQLTLTPAWREAAYCREDSPPARNDLRRLYDGQVGLRRIVKSQKGPYRAAQTS